MVVILEAVSGPIAGRRVEVRGGSILRIGRTGKSDYAIAEDGYLSGVHFSVECDGSQCRIRDLGSSNGTFINGSRVSDHVVAESDSIVAGGTTFRVHMDLQPEIAGAERPGIKTGATPLAVAAKTLSEAAGYNDAQLTLLNALYTPGEQVFAMLDGARDSRIRTFLDSSGEAHASLDSAFLVALPAESQLLHVLIKDGWGRGWGFYGTSTAGLEDVREHFTNFVKVRAACGTPLTFRFWDPRVLRALVPMMPVEEANAFFGPCQRMIVEAETPSMALEFCRGSQRTLVLA